MFTQHGVYHRGWVALDFQLLSSLRGKLPSVWESVNTGIEVLQFVKGEFGGVKRCFAFVLYQGTEIQLWEILPSATDSIDDNDTTPILWSLETAALFHDSERNKSVFKRLEDGELAIIDLQGRLDVTVKFRRDSYPCWQKWTSFSVCAERQRCAPDPLTGCMDILDVPPQTRLRLGFGKPEPACDPISDTPLGDGTWFQLRFEFQGHAKFLETNIAASVVPVQRYAPPACTLPV